MTIGEHLKALTGALHDRAKEEAAQQARLLLCSVLKCAPGALSILRAQELEEELECALDEMLARRVNGEPLQYILGEWAFMGLPIFVEPCALIPRQDTETLAEAATKLARERGYKSALDLCCGTGCIGISLIKLAALEVTATDISPACIQLAQRNAAHNGVHMQTRIGSYFTPVQGMAFDLIVTNPPYIAHAQMNELQTEVNYEPALALDGGPDGMDAYRAIRAEYERHITPGGALMMEVGIGQAEAVRALFDAKTQIVYDYNDIARVVCVYA